MAKETAISLIKITIIIAAFVVTLTTTVFLGGSRIGKTEKTVEIASECIVSLLATQKQHDEDIDTIKTEQAYQKGVIQTKLENLEKSVAEIKRIVIQWETVDSE